LLNAAKLRESKRRLEDRKTRAQDLEDLLKSYYGEAEEERGSTKGHIIPL
jgi:hypothetical protein